MKLTFTKKLFFLFFIGIASITAKGQTTLAAGDIAFTGYIGRGPLTTTDAFSFVLLKAVTSGTSIRFTDYGWRTNTSSFNSGGLSGETEAVLLTTSALPAGTEIKIENTSATKTNGGSAGTLTFTTSTAPDGSTFLSTNFSLNGINGDQVFAYQGSITSPAFIAGIHWNVYRTANPYLDPTNTTDAAWDGTLSGSFINTNTSSLPTTLTAGASALWIYSTTDAADPEKGNGRFVCGSNVSTVPLIRTALYDRTKWTLSDTDVPAVGFSIPTGCNYLGINLPIKLISFKAQNILTDVQLNWSATEQTDFSHFELERSFDGTDFTFLAKVSALPGAGTIDYAYTDKAALKTNVSGIYYRLKMVDVDGRITYSDIVKLSNDKQKDFEITNFQNPLMGNKINFALLTKTNQKASFSITDLYGRQLYKMQQNCNAGKTQVAFPDNISLSSGVYFLNIQLDNEPMQSIKFVKN
jgi:hypothetical protein